MRASISQNYVQGLLLTLALDLTRLEPSVCVAFRFSSSGSGSTWSGAKQINSHLANPLLDDKTSYIHMQIVSYE